jgi:single-strand DNA-binding protein
MNSVQITGNLARDPQMRATKTGRAVASFSVASNRTYTTPQGEQRELTDWINVVAWGALAEAVGNQLHKGSRVFVEGRFQTRSYDTQDGQRRWVSEVVANVIAVPLSTRNSQGGQANGFGNDFNGGHSGQQNSGNSQNQKGDFGQFGTPQTDEDIPF